MQVKTLMLFRNAGETEADNVSCFTVSGESIEVSPPEIRVIGTDGQPAFTLRMADGVKCRVVGVES